MALTPGESRLLAFIRNYMRANEGTCPSMKEMEAGMGIKSGSAIDRYLTSLAKQGRIERPHYGRRAIRVIEEKATEQSLRDVVARILAEDGPARTVAALVDLAKEIVPRLSENRP